MEEQAIWHPRRSATAPYVYLRQNFLLSRTVSQAQIQCACSGAYTLYCNGQWGGRGPTPALVSEPMWTRLELQSLLREGENNLLILAREGDDDTAPSWLRARLQVTYDDGSQVELLSGNPWPVLRADAWQRLIEAPLSMAYLASQEAAGWPQGAAQAIGWEDALVVEDEGAEPRDWHPLPMREGEIWAQRVMLFGETEAEQALAWETDPDPLRRAKCVHREALLKAGRARSVVQVRDLARAVYLVLDLGRVCSGFPRLRLVAQAGAVVDLAIAADVGTLSDGVRYVCKDGTQEWTGQQWWQGRYLVARISHSPAELAIDSISFVERQVQVEPVASGRLSGHPPLEAIWAVGPSTAAACRQEIYDLPAGPSGYDWLGAWGLALNDYYLQGQLQTARATLASARLPRPQPGQWVEGLAYILFAEDYFRHSGDRTMAEELAAAARDILASCGAAHKSAVWLPDPDEGETSLSVNALYSGALAAAARLLRSVGRKSDARDYQERRQQVTAGIQSGWVAEQGLFGTEGEPPSQWANALILFFALTSRERRERIVRSIRSAGTSPVADLRQAFFLTGGLWRAGAGERALDYIEHQWGRLASRPGRTWREKARAERVLPGPEYFLATQLLGVRPAAPGFRKLEIAPFGVPFERIEGRVQTGRGAVEVAWGYSPSMLRLTVTLEEAGPTQLRVPRLNRSFPTLVLNGEVVWRNEKIHPNFVVRDYVSTDDYIGLGLEQSGQYVVVVE